MTEAPNQDQRKRAGDIIGGHYRVVDVLGEGGMGVVYKVEDLKLDGRLRALKMILPERLSDSGAMQRFRLEVKALTALRSDFIVEIVDVNVNEGVSEAFFVTEFLEGRTLENLLREKGPLDRTMVVGLLHQVALALDVMHAKGIAHRDLKPANLFLLKRFDDSIQVKVVDFGIAKFINPNRLTTFIAGSSGYMAPEQAAGYGVDHRADIFAFGRLAAEMLLGEVSATTGQQQTISAPQAFVEWLTKATALNPKERFSSAIETVQRLADALEVPLRLSSTTWSVSSARPGASTPVPTSKSHGSRPQLWLAALLLLAVAALAAILFRGSVEAPTDAKVSASAAPASVPERPAIDPKPSSTQDVPVAVSTAVAVQSALTSESVSPPPPASKPKSLVSMPRSLSPAASSTGRSDPPQAATPPAPATPAAPPSPIRDPSKPKRPVF